MSDFVNWSLLGAPVDIGAHFQSGMKMGQEMVAKRRKENALRAYMTNPNDSTTLNALAVDDPDMAYKLEQIRATRAKTEREGVERAQTVALGQQFASGDTQGAANAALQGGNTELAKTFFSLDKDRRGRLVDMYKGAAPVAYEALKLPYEQRRGYLAQNKPVLLAQGWTEDQINGFDPVDGNLNMLTNSARDLSMLQNMDKVDNQVIPLGATTQPLDFYGRPATGAPAVQPDPLAPEPAPGEGGPVGSVPPPAPRGLTIDRNNNPGAIRLPGKNEFARFNSPQEGIQAQEALLTRAYIGRGVNTVASIVEKYAPRASRGGDNTDEQVNNYIGYVSRRLGIDPRQPIPPAAVPQLAAAMREFETGRRGPAPQPAAPLRSREEQARRAIAAGADPAKVMAQLRGGR